MVVLCEKLIEGEIVNPVQIKLPLTQFYPLAHRQSQSHKNLDVAFCPKESTLNTADKPLAACFFFRRYSYDRTPTKMPSERTISTRSDTIPACPDSNGTCTSTVVTIKFRNRYHNLTKPPRNMTPIVPD